MSKKSVEILKNVHKQTEYNTKDIEKLIDAVSNEVIKIRDKGNSLIIDENDLKFNRRGIRTPWWNLLIPHTALSLIPLASSLMVGGTPNLIVGAGIFATSFLWFSATIDTFDTNFLTTSKKPHWYYRFLLKITPKATKKYSIARQEYQKLVLQLEEYQNYYQKKMELLEPALAIINENLGDIKLSINASGELEKKMAPQTEVKNEITQLLASNRKDGSLSIAL